ncbi:MAG: DNA polymerase III subunit delta [Polyangiaceae bacterium]|nr:DNA polymerase III subunit delta [Polyangiaceae bacterium]
MTPEETLEEVRSGKLRPVYLVMGEERWFVDRALSAIRDAVNRQGIAGFNDDKFTAGECNVQSVIGACKMLPMMAKKRFVLLRSVERWEKKEDDDGAAAKKSKALSPLDELAEYAKSPVDSTVLVLVASKLHGQRRLVTAAKKGGFLVECEPLDRRAIPNWIRTVAKEKGHTIAAEAADQLAELSGTDLPYLADAMERLSLYVGPKNPISAEVVSKLVTRVAHAPVWDLLEAVIARKPGRALAALADAMDERDAALPLLGLLFSAVRSLLKLEVALQEGLDLTEAAKQAGIMPFKARERAQTLRTLPPGTLRHWVELMAAADLALKGSKRSGQAVLETLVLEMSR